MPTTSEMYELGAADAERGEFNPFYYQHYYYYRLGYDSVRRRNRPRSVIIGSILLIGSIGVLLIGALVWLSSQLGPAVVTQTGITPTGITAGETLSPIPPTPTIQPSLTPSPTPTPPTLQIGARAVVVNIGESTLRLRASPGLTARVIARIPAGREVVLLEGPVVADGYTWWRVAVGSQSGWCAVTTPDGTNFLEPLAP